MIAAAGSYFVWPTPYRFEHETFAEVPREEWGLYALAVYSAKLHARRDPVRDSLSKVYFPDEVPGDRLPVSIRSRTSRLTGRREYETWVSRKDGDGASPWLPVDTYMADSEGVYATRGIAIAGGAVSFADRIVRRRLKIVWPALVRDEIESGSFGILKAVIRGQSWAAVPSGTRITASGDSGGGGVEDEHAALELTLNVRNAHASEPASIPDAFYLVDEDSVLLSRLVPVSRSSLVIPPGMARDVRLSAEPVSHPELSRAGGLHVVNVLNGWRWEAVALPSMDVLRGEHRIRTDQ